jgi:H+/gluconate symporter-like permease
LAGGLIGGADLIETTDLMIAGAKNMIPAVLRILAAGVLAGVLIQSGSAAVIAETIANKIGEKRALLALTLATAILTTVGVFVDLAVINSRTDRPCDCKADLYQQSGHSVGDDRRRKSRQYYVAKP